MLGQNVCGGLALGQPDDSGPALPPALTGTATFCVDLVADTIMFVSEPVDMEGFEWEPTTSLSFDWKPQARMTVEIDDEVCP